MTYNVFGGTLKLTQSNLAFESFDLKSLFWYANTFSEYTGQTCISRSSSQGYESKKSIRGGLPSTVSSLV